MTWPVQATTGEPDGRGRAAEEGEHAHARGTLDEGGDHAERRLVADQLDVVEDQHERLAVVEDLEQGRHQLQLG